MPGKVNPVMCESLMQVAARVIGNDQTMTMCGAAGGQFQLNIMMPVMGHTTLESISLMSRGSQRFVDFCIDWMRGQSGSLRGRRRAESVDGHQPESVHWLRKSVQLAKEAFHSGKTIRELCEEQNVLPPEQLREALDPMA